MASVIDLLLFHHMERSLFQRFVKKMGMETVVAKQVIALWLWLESIGHHDLIRHIFSQSDRCMHSIVNEALACLDCLRPEANQPIENNDIPIVAGLIKEPINLRFFHYNRDVAVIGIRSIMDRVCDIIFDDNIMEIAARDADHPANQMVMSAGFIIRPFGEGASGQCGGSSMWVNTDPFQETANCGDSFSAISPTSITSVPNPGITISTPTSNLNPSARPWAPEPTSQDQRSMFLTFSRGYPLGKEEIVQYFASRWGNCIEHVMIERTPPGVFPMFGRLVLNSVSVIPKILNGQQRAKFVIKGRHLWARMFVPKK